MSLSEEEKVDVRRHMGYLNVQEASTFVLGVPAGVQTQFMIEPAMNKLLAAAEPVLRRYLIALNAIECQIMENTENLAVESLGQIKINLDEFKMVLQRYKYWQGALGNLLGCIPNPFDMRPWLGAGWNGGTAVNVPVQN